MTKLGFSLQTSLLASAAIIAISVASPAAAQIDTQQPAAQSTTDEGGETIVITAQKREERILDIPQSVTVVSGETIEREQATTFEDYLNQIPGLSLNQSEPGEARLVLRGVNTGGVSSTVAVYVDETPFGSSTALVNGAVLAGDFDPFDLSRIEVLRGPQGTLYGASSLGGVFKFVTNEPELGRVAARGRAGVEFIDNGGTGYFANGMVNVPLGDIAAFRATGTFRKQAGWVDADPQDITFNDLFGFGNSFTVRSSGENNINDNKVLSGRGSLLVKPSDALTIRLTAYGQNLRTHASSNVEVEPDSYEPLRSKFGRTVLVPEFSDVDYRVYSGNVEYDFGFATLLSATSYSKLRTDFRTDLSLLLGATINSLFGPLNPNIPGIGLPEPITDQPIAPFQNQTTGVKKFTQEFRLASPSNDRFEWMVGAYYTREKGLIDQHISGRTFTGSDSMEDELADLIALNLESRYREIAGFTNATWHLTDRFDITVGGRLSENKQRAEQAVGGPLTPFQFGFFPEFEPGKSKESVFTYSVSPRFELSNATAVYGRVAKGYRPGGPNVIPPLSGGELEAFPTSFDADTLTSYEVGLKTDIGRRFNLDLAAYHLKWKDIQVFGQTPSGFGFNANGDGARVNGFEATVSMRPMRGLNVSMNTSWIDAKLTDDTPVIVGGRKGDRLPFTPNVSAAVNADYEWGLSPTATAFVGGSLRWTGDQRSNFRIGVVGGAITPLPQRTIPDFTTADLRAGVDFGRFTVEAFARNVTNARGMTSVNDATGIPGGGILAAFMQPRTIGFTFGAKY